MDSVSPSLNNSVKIRWRTAFGTRRLSKLAIIGLVALLSSSINLPAVAQELDACTLPDKRNTKENYVNEMPEIMAVSLLREWIQRGNQDGDSLIMIRDCLRLSTRWSALAEDPRDFGFDFTFLSPIELPELYLATTELAMALRIHGHYSLAAQLQRWALSMPKPSLDDPSVRLFGLVRLALFELLSGDFKQVGSTIDLASTITVTNDVNPIAFAEFLDVRGQFEGATGQWSQAQRSHQLAIDSNGKIPAAAKAEYLNNLGVARYHQSHFTEALQFIDKAQSIRTSLYPATHPVQAESAYNRSAILDATGEYRQSLKQQKKALDIRLGLFQDTHPAVVDSLNNLGIIYSHLGDEKTAKGYIERACTVVESAIFSDPLAVATCLHNRSHHLKLIGEYGEAIRAQKEALSIRTQTLPSPHEKIANSLNNYGLLHGVLGDTALQLSYLEQAFDQRIKLHDSDHIDIADSLNDLGYAHIMQGNLEEARVYLERSLAMRTRLLGEHHLHLSVSLSNLGHVYFLADEYEEARIHHQAALSILEQLDTVPDIHFVQVWNNLAQSVENLHEGSNAESLYLKALSALDESRYSLYRVTVEGNLARLLHDRERPELAVFYQKQAVNRLLGHKTDLSQPQQLSFMQSYEDQFRQLTKWLIELNRYDEANQVMNALDHYQNRQFVRSELNEASITSTSEENRLWITIKTLIDRIRTIPPTDEQILNEAVANHRDIEIEKKKEISRLGMCSSTALTKGITAVSHNSDDKLLVRYLVAKKELIIHMQYYGKVRTCTHDISREELAQTAADYRAQLLSGRWQASTEVPAQSRRLYEALFRPIEHFLEGSMPAAVVVDLDSALRFIPVAAWHNGEYYLGELYPLARHVQTSLTQAPEHHAKKQIAGFGLSVPHSEEPTSPLPWVRVELNNVIKTGPADIGSLDGDIYLDENFVPKAYYDVLDTDVSIIHVTGHFKLEPGELRYSRFYTGGGEYLYADRLFNGRDKTTTNLQGVELMMLPSCETALGVNDIAQLGKDFVPRERSFEGEGLAAGVIANGAGALVASLWHVEDASTSNFVQMFYRYLAQELPPAQALMHTRRDFARKNIHCESVIEEVKNKYHDDDILKAQINKHDCIADWSQPYYWAGLTLFEAI